LTRERRYGVIATSFSNGAPIIGRYYLLRAST